MRAAIAVERLGIRFDLDRQQRPMTPALTHVRLKCSTTWVFREMTFAIQSGAAVALIGPNGVGKTTVLKAIAGVLVADEGSVTVRGRVGSLLSVGAGLMPRLTGRENAVLLGVLAGERRRAARESVESIKVRSGLESAFERPVSTYSQGMRARLGFAVIEQSDPDILLLDEVHEALDGSFRAHLQSFVWSLRERGGIVVAAGHDHAELSNLCDQAMLLDGSGIVAIESFELDGDGAPLTRDTALSAGA